MNCTSSQNWYKSNNQSTDNHFILPDLQDKNNSLKTNNLIRQNITQKSKKTKQVEWVEST